MSLRTQYIDVSLCRFWHILCGLPGTVYLFSRWWTNVHTSSILMVQQKWLLEIF